jgi:predicted nuclease of predicted toxin-antitoxin system
MQFLANENFPLTSIRLLREARHSVAAIVEDSPGISDQEVLVRAAHEQLTIITFDRDYGELIYRRKAPCPAGVIYLRFDPITPDEPANLLLRLLSQSDLAFERKFTVVERQQVRQRWLPS